MTAGFVHQMLDLWPYAKAHAAIWVLFTGIVHTGVQLATLLGAACVLMIGERYQSIPRSKDALLGGDLAAAALVANATGGVCVALFVFYCLEWQVDPSFLAVRRFLPPFVDNWVWIGIIDDGALAFVCVILIRKGVRASAVDVHGRAPKRWFRYSLVALAVSVIVVFRGYLFPSSPIPESPHVFRNMVATKGTILVWLVWVVTVVPCVEEFLFRGLIFDSFARIYGFLPGLVLQAIAFALVHGPENVIYLLLVGIILGLFYRYSKSLRQTIAIHAVANGIAVLGHH